MCGIAGVFSVRHSPQAIHAAAERMQKALVHRGPDDAGLWQSPCQQAVLSHRRLSILDLSAAGRQPMSTPDGRYTICFNGEIYNFRELRAQLEKDGIIFATNSDTEVILRLYEKDGIDCAKQLRGMFAFAIWDDHTRTAALARDPLGIKPLYVHRTTGTLAFASELRALCQSQLFTPTLNANAVQRYLQSGSVPEPLTLIHEAECLEAGHTLLWHENQSSTQTYWRMHLPSAAPAHGDHVQLTRAALRDSIDHHFVSDVPVGVFLSGGIDSTAILALANATGHQGVRAFCIAVDDEAADESPIARRTAEHFKADFNEMRLDASTAKTLFGNFLNHLDQPTIDGLNTFTVSSLAHQQGMKVVLSGLGGDELFGGYSSFAKIPKMLRWHRWIKRVPGIDSLLQSKPQHRRLAEFLNSPGTIEDAYAALRGVFSRHESGRLASWITGQPADVWHPLFSHPPREATLSDQISTLEISRYMRNQLLRDSDIMSMAHSLELRVPFVDRQLIDSVAQIPAKVRLRSNKRLLTDAVPEVPDWVVNQKKRGFLFPYEKWLGSDWGASFDTASKGAPVPVVTWYQKWSLFVLRHCMKSLGL